MPFGKAADMPGATPPRPSPCCFYLRRVLALCLLMIISLFFGRTCIIIRAVCRICCCTIFCKRRIDPPRFHKLERGSRKRGDERGRRFPLHMLQQHCVLLLLFIINRQNWNSISGSVWYALCRWSVSVSHACWLLIQFITRHLMTFSSRVLALAAEHSFFFFSLGLAYASSVNLLLFPWLAESCQWCNITKATETFAFLLPVEPHTDISPSFHMHMFYELFNMSHKVRNYTSWTMYTYLLLLDVLLRRYLWIWSDTATIPHFLPNCTRVVCIYEFKGWIIRIRVTSTRLFSQKTSARVSQNHPERAQAINVLALSKFIPDIQFRPVKSLIWVTRYAALEWSR
jgi:hypothetical protein